MFKRGLEALIGFDQTAHAPHGPARR
jgi:hypothetical protein